MNLSVVLFFVTNVLAAALLGGKFFKKQDSVLKYFGIGLMFDALAFAMWTIGYVNSAQLLTFVTLGAISFLVSLVFFLYASLQGVSARLWLTVLGVVAIIAIFFVGRYSVNLAYVSPEGLLFFNLTPLVQMLYIFALSFTFIPLIGLVASKFEGGYAMLVRYGFIAQLVGGIMLITSKDVQVLYIVGWVIGIIYFVLWATLFFSKKAWLRTN